MKMIINKTEILEKIADIKAGALYHAIHHYNTTGTDIDGYVIIDNSGDITFYESDPRELDDLRFYGSHVDSRDLVVGDSKQDNVKKIYYGKVNDASVYAMDDGCGGIVALTKEDAKDPCVKPDYQIFFDGGIYPSITNVDQYICNQVRVNGLHR
jgi:hypothetical protein